MRTATAAGTLLAVTSAGLIADPPSPSCVVPGSIVISQSLTNELSMGGITCTPDPDAGVSAAVSRLRRFTLEEIGVAAVRIDCVEFGYLNYGSEITGSIDLYVDADGGDPGPVEELVPFASRAVTIPSGPGGGVLTVDFDNAGFMLSETETLLISLALPASPDNLVGGAGQTSAEVEVGSTFWIYSPACGIEEFTAFEDLVPGYDLQWYVAAAGSTSVDPLTLDCDGNGVMDGVDIHRGAADLNGDGILDACQGSPADLDGDGCVGGSDLGVLFTNWGTDGVGDLDGDGTVGSADLGALLATWGC
jgi:hypothetical protein